MYSNKDEGKDTMFSRHPLQYKIPGIFSSLYYIIYPPLFLMTGELLLDCLFMPVV